MGDDCSGTIKEEEELLSVGSAASECNECHAPVLAAPQKALKQVSVTAGSEEGVTGRTLSARFKVLFWTRRRITMDETNQVVHLSRSAWAVFTA